MTPRIFRSGNDATNWPPGATAFADVSTSGPAFWTGCSEGCTDTRGGATVFVGTGLSATGGCGWAGRSAGTTATAATPTTAPTTARPAVRRRRRVSAVVRTESKSPVDAPARRSARARRSSCRSGMVVTPQQQRCGQRVPGAGEARLDGAFGDPEGVCHLSHAQIADVVEDDDLPRRHRQLSQGTLQITGVPVGGIRDRVGVQPAEQVREPVAVAVPVGGEPHGDQAQPGLGSVVPGDLLPARHEPHERLLDDVLGLGTGSGQQRDHDYQPWLMHAVELPQLVGYRRPHTRPHPRTADPVPLNPGDPIGARP